MGLFEELKRRTVIRVGIAYCVTAWVLAQIAEFAFENFGAPEWVLKTVVVVLMLGLPLVLLSRLPKGSTKPAIPIRSCPDKSSCSIWDSLASSKARLRSRP